MKSEKPVIIDVRNPEQFAQGHVAGSLNIPLQEMEGRLDEIKRIQAPIVVVCGGGTRNIKAHELLKKHGLENTAGGSWKKYQ